MRNDRVSVHWWLDEAIDFPGRARSARLVESNTTMKSDERYRRYLELQAYVGWTDEDARHVQSVAQHLDPFLTSLVDDFYAEIERHPNARKVITGGDAQIDRLKGTLVRWLRELLSGPYDREYVIRRWLVGWRHVEIGLDQVYTNVALSRLRRGLSRILEAIGHDGSIPVHAIRRSLDTLIDLDLAIIEDAYQAEHTARQRRSERLAALGQSAEEIERLNKDLQHRVHDLQTLLDVIPIGIAIAHDPSCKFVRVNPALARLLRVAPDADIALAGQRYGPTAFKILRDGKEPAAGELPMQVAGARGIEVRDQELDIVHADGEVINLFGHAAPLFDEHRRPRGVVAAFVDITERKRSQERALQTERLAAIGEMMTGLAHESGNALARSQACLEMLALEVQDRTDALDLVARVQKAQDHLRQLYEEVRGYAAPLKLEREVWDVSGIWRQAWTNLALRRQGREACLREETGESDLSCVVDHFRLEQVFRNILENALAACRDPVCIDVRCCETVFDGRPALRIAVCDNGPGLTPEQHQRIFEPFYTTKTKGTGLGMAIAKRIVEAHGGQIAAGSGKGQGTEIVITMPRECQ